VRKNARRNQINNDVSASHHNAAVDVGDNQITTDPLAEIVRQGHYAVSALQDPSSRELLLEMEREKEKRRAVSAATRFAEKEAKKAQWNGFIKLSDIIKDMGAKRAHALNAIKQSGILTVKGMIRPDELDKARSAIQGYAPPVRLAVCAGGMTFALDSVIRVKKGAKNPKKPGTAIYKDWAKVLGADGWTIDKFRKAKGNSTSLRNCVVKKLVMVEEVKGGKR